MDRHFRCTACGKCCFGWLPLTVAEALAHAGRFPLAVVWTPVRQAGKAFDMTARLGLTARTRDRKPLAVRITPTAYIPPSMPCPALTGTLCGIHEDKPARCRAMPLFAYVDEAQQAEQLIPRPGWDCDTSAAAPVVYRDRTVVERADFDAERRLLLDQAASLRAYGEWLIGMVPGMIDNLAKAALKPGAGGHVAVSFATLLRRLAGVDTEAIARAQLRVLAQYAEAVAADPALAGYGRSYRDWMTEMERLAG